MSSFPHNRPLELGAYPNIWTPLFRLRPHLRVTRGNCSLWQVRIQGACSKSEPSRQNLKSKSFRLAFCLKRFTCSPLSAFRNERDIPLVCQRRHCLTGFAGHSYPIGNRVGLVTAKPFVRVFQTHARSNKIGKLIKRLNPSPIRHQLAGCEAAVILPGVINDHGTG